MKNLIFTAILLLVLSSAACAESLTLGVTLTIPEVPGLNAPPLEAQATPNPPDAAARETRIEQALNSAQQAPSLIFVQVITQGKTIQTVYSR